MKFIAKNIAKKLATTGGVPLLLVLSLTMCSEDVLDKQPLGTLTDETFYKTEKDFDAATLAPYSTMLNLTYEQFGAGLWNGFLKPDDDVQHRDPNDAMDEANNPRVIRCTAMIGTAVAITIRTMSGRRSIRHAVTRSSFATSAR